jgi:chromosome segregation ATPase
MEVIVQDESAKLKKLQTRLTNSEKTIKELKEKKQDTETAIEIKEGEKKQIKKEIEDLKKKLARPIVTEHAILRYFERILGYDLDDIREEILSEEVLGYIHQMGISKGELPNNKNEHRPFKLVLSKGKIVTVKIG